MLKRFLGNGILKTTILMMKITIYRNRERGRAAHINEIKYHINTQMKYDYYVEIDQKTEKILRKWGDIYLDRDP